MTTWHKMMTPEEAAIVVLGLTLFKRLLPKSRYHVELQEILDTRIEAIIKKIQEPVDAYGNPY